MSVEEQPVETTLYSLSTSAPHPLDRRDGEPHLTVFRVGTVTVGDRRELCLVKNISKGGMLIRAYCPLKPGTRLAVELKRGEPIEGMVSWVRDACVGVTFNEPIDVVALLANAMEGPQPGMPRVEICCIASVRVGANVYDMRAHGISQDGLKVAFDRPLEIGSDVVVTLPGLTPQHGVVRSNERTCYGITFNRLLALSEIVQWLREQRALLRAAG